MYQGFTGCYKGGFTTTPLYSRMPSAKIRKKSEKPDTY